MGCDFINRQLTTLCTFLVTFILVGCSTSQPVSKAESTPNTVSTTSNDTPGTNNDTPPSVKDNSTTNVSSSSQPTKISSKSQATDLANSLYSGELKSDDTLKIALAATDESNGQTIYVFHVFSDTTKGRAPKAWVFIRSDGMVEDGVLQHGWVSPSEFFATYPNDK